MGLEQQIDEMWESGSLDPAVVEEAVALLDAGTIRVAEPAAGGWVVNEWVKKAILLYFRVRKVEPMDIGGLHFLDKIPVKTDYADRGVRVVPPGRGALRLVPLGRLRADAGVREHRRLGRAADDGRHVGHRRLVRADRRRRAPGRAASGSAVCSSRRRPRP